jgi:asparagine synthase (glutamine-hydrolysing)
MCGLAFLYREGLPADDRQARMREALHLLRHRGPDDSGLQSGEAWCIGHRRLSIVDLAASRQPMGDPSGRYWLAYNGEVYNFRELRAELDSRWVFHTQGDTEVVLAGLVLEGESFLRRMEGMWALALWDRASRNLLLSRDRMGKKPLYYAMAGPTMACASELPALSRLADRPWSEDPDSLADYLRYGFFLPGTTAYREVREVLPGHALAWSPDIGCREWAYWTLAPGRFAGSKAEAAEQLRETLTRAVAARLVADVEVGAFLSGGIDSSLISALAQRQLDRPLRTFTMGFADPAFDERHYARQVAEQLGTRHTEDELPSETPDALESLILNHVGQPFADASLLPTAGISELAARHVKVVLSGDGGDELFCGYQRYQARQILRWYTRLPQSVRKTAEQAIRLLPEPTAHHSRSLLKKAHLFTRIAERLESETPYVSARLFSEPELASLAPELAGRGHTPPGLLAETTLDDLPRMMFADTLVYLPQDILLKVDRASMAHGLEVRAPFLDRRVVELAFSLPAAWHRNPFEGKRLLRYACTGLIPEHIWKRRKQGFATPVHRWFGNGLGEPLAGALSAPSALFNEPHIRRMIQEHQSGRRDHGYRLWALYVYLLWRNSIANRKKNHGIHQTQI